MKRYKMDGKKYLRIRRALQELNGVHVQWHPDSEQCAVSGDILMATNRAMETGKITSSQMHAIYEVFSPDNIIY